MFIVFIIILIILLGYIFPKSKIVFALITLLNIIIIGGYNGTGDLDNYFYRYNYGIIEKGYFESVFDLIANIFNNYNVPFEIFHLTISAISIGIMAYIIYKTSKKPAFAIALFTGYSTLEYALQLKAMCAASIIVFALYYYYKKIYIEKGTLKNKLIYIMLIVFATGFHFMSPFFLIFLLIDFVNIKKIKKFVIIMTPVIIFCAPYLISELSKYISNLDYYNDMHRSITSTIAFCLWQIISLIIIKKITYKKSINEKSLDLFVYKGSWLLLLIMPFYSITLVINRLLKIWSMFFYIQASNIQIKKRYASFEVIAMVGYSIGSFVLFYMLLLDMSGNTYNVLLDVLHNNIFLRS